MTPGVKMSLYRSLARASISVVVKAPLAGLLISYEGEIEPKEPVGSREPIV